MATQWTTVCTVDDIWLNSGVCALLGNRQVAVFRLHDGRSERVLAIDNHDPCSGANVLSRGLVGNLGDHLVVASPIYKQHFDLVTGECLEDASKSVRVWPVRLVDGRVEIAA